METICLQICLRYTIKILISTCPHDTVIPTLTLSPTFLGSVADNGKRRVVTF